MINADALAALQIFDDANHANVHSNAKTEGLSIFRKYYCAQPSIIADAPDRSALKNPHTARQGTSQKMDATAIARDRCAREALRRRRLLLQI